MDAPWAREQLRRRYLFPPEVELDCEEEAKPETPTAVERKERPLPRLNIHSGFWILASIVVTYYVDFFKTFKENFHTNSWFLFGGALLFVSLSIAFYCIVYLEWYRGIEEYDVKYPTLVPITTATFIAAGVCHTVGLFMVGAAWKDVKSPLLSAGLLCVCIYPESFNLALWNVWSFFTPLLLFTQFMGVVMFISLLG